MTARPMLVIVTAVASLALAPAAVAAPKDEPTPMIFVHGNSGSAQQFETNAMRLTSNGFPQNRIFAYEYDTLASNNDVAVANLDGFIANVKERTGADQVDILAHSRGTTVMHTYLVDAGARRVRPPLRELRRPHERRRRPGACPRSPSGARATRRARSAAPRTSTSPTRPTPR